MTDFGTTRRVLLRSSLAASALLGLGGVPASASQEPATPACSDAADLTPAQTAGPFYTPDTPRKTDFTGDGDGMLLMLSGFVVSTACQPLPGAIVDLWHADAGGRYDNAGYRFRGHQFTDADGRFGFLTVVPGLYPGRTRHLHVRVQAPGSRLLTTQLYFSGGAANASDRIFDSRLTMDAQASDSHVAARFDFALELA